MIFGGALLLLAATCATTSPASSLTARLLCDKNETSFGEAMECDLFLENVRQAELMIIPKTLLPFELRFRPPTVVEFEATREGHTFKLAVALEAQRGRYDLGTLSSEGLLLLAPGRIYGWRYDLNRADWLLPTVPGTYEVRARLRVHLLKPRKDGSLEEAVREALGPYSARARSLVMDGEWVSNSVTLTVVPRRSSKDNRTP
jgi:hypothetical protein